VGWTSPVSHIINLERMLENKNFLQKGREIK
jgi:hypothetical protein